MFVDEKPEIVSAIAEHIDIIKLHGQESEEYIKRPFFLAGGLTPDNEREAIHTLHPFAVDVKDIAKMAAFVDAVRREKS